jgi:alkylation response protein AidB-like acyl-CoA dehydrogenase
MSTTPTRPADPDLLLSETEEDLQRTVRDLLRARSGTEALLGLSEGDRSPVEPLWRSLAAELGLAGLLVPEESGGAGASTREAGVVLEELGAGLAPVPFLTSAVVATRLLVALGPPAAEGLAAVAAGERTLALAVPLSTAPDAPLPTFEPCRDGGLSGRVRSVAGALEADALLVPVDGPDGTEVHLVDAVAARVEPVVSLDMTRPLADVTLDATAGRVLARDAAPAVHAGLRAGAALLASEQVGLARHCLESTVAYLRERRQFGRVLGSFQALKHRLADLVVEVEQASAAARWAAAVMADRDDPHEVAVATATAQAYCSAVAVHAAEEAVQLHGGIGMTWEHDTHLYLKRAKADEIALGTPGTHRARLAGLVDLPGVES